MEDVQSRVTFVQLPQHMARGSEFLKVSPVHTFSQVEVRLEVVSACDSYHVPWSRIVVLGRAPTSDADRHRPSFNRLFLDTTE